MLISRILLLALAMALTCACGPSDQAVSYPIADTTNKDWVNGVAKDWATGFVLKNRSDAAKDFTAGKKVTFSDGSVRSIKSNQVYGTDLIVYLDGNPLDGNVVGYPHAVKLSSQ